jgi:N-acetyl-gamma-glutamyl-phosphate reductase
MPRVHIVGAAGYAAAEVIRLVVRHPFLQLGVIESDSHCGEPVGAHMPLLRTLQRTFDAPLSAFDAIEPGDIVVAAGSPETARAAAGAFLERGAGVVDLSDAFRLHAHSGGATYGFTERYRDALRGARLVANPGCYPTAALLALWPLARLDLGIRHVVIDAKSGITGAGRKPALGSLFAEVDGDVRAYALEGHRHAAEMEQELGALGIEAPLTFTPQVVPLRRGMLASAYVFCERAPEASGLAAAYARTYAGSPFVRVNAERAPSLLAIAGTNDAEIHPSCSGHVVRVLCAIDNLGKGAAGQAVQNINVMLGLPEDAGLHDRAIVA